MRGTDILDGLYPGIVTSSKDPLNMGRIKLRFPWLDDSEQSHWARLVQPYAGKERGLFFVPEVGDEVICVFEMGDLHQPLVIGASWNGADEPSEPGDPDGSNHHKVIETRSGHKLHFDDTPGAEFIQLHDGAMNNIVRWDSADNSITITAKTGDIIIKAPQGRISLLAKDIEMQVSNNASRTVGGDESTKVSKAATEGESSSKDWSAASSLSGSAKVVVMGASGSMSIGGGSASLSTDEQTDKKISVEGATTDTVSDLQINAKHMYERAESRTLNIGATELKSANVVMDASGAINISTGIFNASGKGGQLSLLGESINTQSGSLMMKSGQIQLNPKQPAPPKPGVANKVLISAFKAGLKG